MKSVLVLIACACALLAPVSRLHAQTTPAPANDPPVGVTVPAFAFGIQGEAQQNPKKPSPWLLLPLVSSGPKMGTSFGGLGSYLHHFDPKSQVSMFGLMYQVQHHQIAGGGLVRANLLQGGQPAPGGTRWLRVHQERVQGLHGLGADVPDDDKVALGAGRYLYRVKGPWFIGAEAAFGNYTVEGETDLQNKVLNMLGLAGFQMGSAGPVLMHDSRDNQDMPVRGWYTT